MYFWLLLLCPLLGYGFAWYGHFFLQRNVPATFTYPVWSFMGDYKMIFMMLSGRLDRELKRAAGRAGVNPPSRP